MQITSFDQLIDYSIECLLNDQVPEDLTFSDGLNYRIKIDGDDWDGRIDYRSARYIMDIQKALVEIQRDILEVDERGLGRVPLVKATVTDGSLEMFVEFKDTIKEMVAKMDGKQALIAIALCGATITGVVGIPKYFDYRKSIEERALDEATKQKAIQVLEDVIEHQTNMEKPNRNLINSMKKNDVIQLPYQTGVISKAEARTRYPDKQRIPMRTDYVDGEYTICSINLEKDPIQFTLEKDGIRFSAHNQLSTEDIEPLFGGLAGQHENGTFAMNLQVTVRHNTRAIKDASVTGLGDPREKAKQLSALLRKGQ